MFDFNKRYKPREMKKLWSKSPEMKDAYWERFRELSRWTTRRSVCKKKYGNSNIVCEINELCYQIAKKVRQINKGENYDRPI